jgi:hypothetical protein
MLRIVLIVALLFTSPGFIPGTRATDACPCKAKNLCQLSAKANLTKIKRLINAGKREQGQGKTRVSSFFRLKAVKNELTLVSPPG